MKRFMFAAVAALLTTPVVADSVAQAQAAADIRAEICAEKIAKGQNAYGETGFCPVRVIEDVQLRDRSGVYIEGTESSMRITLVENGIYLLDEKFFGKAWKSVMVPWQTTAVPEIQNIDPEAIGVYGVVEIENGDAISFWVIRRDGSFYNLTEAVKMTPSS